MKEGIAAVLLTGWFVVNPAMGYGLVLTSAVLAFICVRLWMSDPAMMNRSLNKEKVDLLKKLERAYQKIAELTNENMALKDELRTIQTEFRSLRSDFTAMSQQYTEMGKRVDVLTKELKEVKQVNDEQWAELLKHRIRKD